MIGLCHWMDIIKKSLGPKKRWAARLPFSHNMLSLCGQCVCLVWSIVTIENNHSIQLICSIFYLRFLFLGVHCLYSLPFAYHFLLTPNLLTDCRFWLFLLFEICLNTMSQHHIDQLNGIDKPLHRTELNSICWLYTIPLAVCVFVCGNWSSFARSFSVGCLFCIYQIDLCL